MIMTPQYTPLIPELPVRIDPRPVRGGVQGTLPSLGAASGTAALGRPSRPRGQFLARLMPLLSRVRLAQRLLRLSVAANAIRNCRSIIVWRPLGA